MSCTEFRVPFDFHVSGEWCGNFLGMSRSKHASHPIYVQYPSKSEFSIVAKFTTPYLKHLECVNSSPCWPGNSVGIATDYGLDGPGSNPGGDEIFRPSRPALGPIQPPVLWVPDLSRGYRWPGRGADPPTPI